ncbi:D-aminoacyl-tRNA deacylase [Tomitella gaofuii]|uniref:D-aminoacyl-tRNA deacylase n=1 Tax=Tomitella gaofuii TaxID=2760083 RepID=UPI0015FB3C14|nr:D-aminoacyl-tRNA deacylase [Tomitella gaofuii]
MRAVVQRVTWARVQVDGDTVGEILVDGSGDPRAAPPGVRQGLLVLVGATHSDDDAAARAMAAKIWRLRILDGERSASDLGAPVLVVSQFTLYGDARKGRRPSWNRAAPGAVAEPLVDALADALRELGAHVEAGLFGAHMQVSSTNDGPVTLLLEN